jgi:hypothetical protein
MICGVVLARLHHDLYDVAMADNPHRSLWLPPWLWTQYASVVGDRGRTADLKMFMDWRIDHTEPVLGPDVAPPCDFLATLRVESERWELYMDTVGEGEASAEMRRYIWWRIQHPSDPLPGRRLGPMRRDGRPAMVCLGRLPG